MEDRPIEARESLELIARMIDHTRHRLERGAGIPFLIWGYVTLTTTLAVTAAVYRTGDPRWNWLWLAIPLIGWAGMLLTRRRTTERHVRTFIDRVVAHIWTVLGLAVWTVFIPLRYNFTHQMPVLPVVLLLMGCGTAITGLVVRFPLLTAGGAVAILLAPVLLLVPGFWNPLLFGAGFALMMILPGHALNYRSRHPKEDRHE